jgi:3-hydroxyisobutyrate dehydrogenase
VAILGVGKMGGAIARRLDTGGHEVFLWNRTRDRAEKLVVGTVSNTPAEAAAAAEVVLTVLTGPEADAAAYEGEGGAIKAADGRLFVDVTTGGPANARRLDAAVRAAGGRFLEAPVLGGPAAIESGKLVILAGGEAADVDEARPLLAELGEIRHVGGVGSAASLKLISNSMLAGVSALAAELQAAGESSGVSRDDIFWALQRAAPTLEMRKAGYLDQRYHPVMFALKDMLKDIGLALEVYSAGGASVPVMELTRALYESVAEEHGEDDMSAINARFRTRANKPR